MVVGKFLDECSEIQRLYDEKKKREKMSVVCDRFSRCLKGGGITYEVTLRCLSELLFGGVSQVRIYNFFFESANDARYLISDVFLLIPIE